MTSRAEPSTLSWASVQLRQTMTGVTRLTLRCEAREELTGRKNIPEVRMSKRLESSEFLPIHGVCVSRFCCQAGRFIAGLNQSDEETTDEKMTEVVFGLNLK